MPASSSFDPHLGLVARAGWHSSLVAVCDCDYLLNLAIEIVLGGSRRNPVGGIGTTRCFAPARIANELAWNYERAARRSHVEAALVRDALNESIMPHIRFVDLADSPLYDDSRLRMLEAADEDDVELGRLAMLLARCQVLSLDKHLRHSKLAPATHEKREELIAAGLQIEVSDGAVVGAAFGVQIAAGGLSHGVRSVSARVEAPGWLVGITLLGIVSVVATWVLWSPQRRAKVARAIEVAGAMIEDMQSQRAEALATVEQVSVSPPASDDPERQIARTLAVSNSSMLASEIRSVLCASDHEALGVGEILRILRENSAFVLVDRNRWQLGQRLHLLSDPN
jgi:type II secretory pathway pseudopilin PulG